ncbi:MAG: polysaccharide export protein [Nitrospirae bacterium]|nr:polysaccharide export protein [Nitrospirota bacterium]
MRFSVFYIFLFILSSIFFLTFSGCSTLKSSSLGKEAAVSQPLQPAPEELYKEAKPAEFILGPGDIVEIKVYRHDDLTMIAPIDTSGKISYPLVGDIQASGLSIFQLRDKIRDGISEYIKDPQVSVSIKSVQSQKVYVLGEVVKPGVFTINTSMNVLEAISSAGGFTKDAKDKSVFVIRGNRDNPQLIKLDLKDALKKGSIAHNIELQGNDIVFVPATFIADASRFAVYLRNLLWPVLLFEETIVRGKDVTDVMRGEDITGRTVIIERPPE